jgi:leader peptidase (prepilin peptidase)/N-methyltransferase
LDYLVAGTTAVATIGLGSVTARVVRHFAPQASFPFVLGVLLTILITAWCVRVVPATYLLPCTVVLGWTLLTLSMIDAWVLRLPDALVFPLLALGLATFAGAGREWLDHAIGAIAGFLVFAGIAWSFSRLRGHTGLGLGDAKLAAVAGAWLGWMSLPSIILLAAVGGLLTYLVAALRRGPTAWREPIPFGIPLSLAIWLTWLYGPIA